MGFAEFQNFEIGKQVGPAHIVVNTQRVRDFIYAVDDFHPWYISNSPFGTPIAPVPLLTTDDPDFAALQVAGPQDALAAKFEIRSLAPIAIGERVSMQARHVNKYVRRNKGYIVRDFEVFSLDHDRPAIKSRVTEMVGPVTGLQAASGSHEAGYPAGERIAPSEVDHPVASRASRGLAPGAPLPKLSKKVTRKQMFVFSARPGWWTSIHTDPDFARSLGFRDAIAQGLMSTGYVSQLSTDFFSESWFTTGAASLTFIKPVYVDEVLTIGGGVKGYEMDADGRTRLHLDVWCTNCEGELKTVGRVSADLTG